MKSVSGTNSIFNKLVRDPVVAMTASALALGSSGCNPSQDTIRASHAPMVKSFDLHPALSKHLKSLGNSEAREEAFNEVVSGKVDGALKLAKFHTIANKGFYPLFNLKDADNNFVFNQNDKTVISFAVAHVQDELEQLENSTSNTSQEEFSQKFYDLVNSKAMKLFCKAWDLQKPIPENPLVARAIKYFENNLMKFPAAADLNLGSAIEKLNESPTSGMKLATLKSFTNKALGIKAIPAKPKAEVKTIESEEEKSEKAKTPTRSIRRREKRQLPQPQLPALAHEVIKVA